MKKPKYDNYNDLISYKEAIINYNDYIWKEKRNAENQKISDDLFSAEADLKDEYPNFFSMLENTQLLTWQVKAFALGHYRFQVYYDSSVDPFFERQLDSQRKPLDEGFAKTWVIDHAGAPAAMTDEDLINEVTLKIPHRPKRRLNGKPA